MQIDIQGPEFLPTAALLDDTERRLRFSLTRTSARIKRVVVRLGDRNGPAAARTSFPEYRCCFLVNGANQIMMIGDAIDNASSEYEIYFLLTSYIESVQYCRRLNKLPGHFLHLPMTGMADVRMRLDGLSLEFDQLSQSADHEQRVRIGEAVEIFAAALSRLRRLDQGTGQPLGAERSAGLLEAA